jgi:hypothetical protein
VESPAHFSWRRLAALGLDGTRIDEEEEAQHEATDTNPGAEKRERR